SRPTRPTTRFEESIFRSLPVASGGDGLSPIDPPVALRSTLLAWTLNGLVTELSPAPLKRASRMEPAAVVMVASPLVMTWVASRSPFGTVAPTSLSCLMNTPYVPTLGGSLGDDSGRV